MTSPDRTEALDISSLKGEPIASLALARGATIVDAAKAALVNERTIRRRLELPEYRMEVSRLRGKLLERAVGKLIAATTDAAETMQALLNATSEHVRLGAAKGILELRLSLQEALETQQRITTLEELYVQQCEERLTMWRRDVVKE